MNYKLIILSFGAKEAAAYSSGNDNWYEKQMINVINNLKSVFSQTSILLIGVGDHSIKVKNKFVTDPRVSEVNNVELEIAAKTGIAFWDLFSAMGGYNSMATWVHANPPLEAWDYQHFTNLGAEKIGHILSTALIAAYRNSK